MKEIEGVTDEPLLNKNVYYEFEKIDIKIRVHHVDSHLKFQHVKPTMSTKGAPVEKQHKFFGHDDSRFKQYSFSKNC